MARVLVVGYGNPLGSDEAVGWGVAEALSAASLGPDLEIVQCRELNPELVDPISRAELVIFVRVATPDDSPPGVNHPAGAILERDIEPACESASCFSQNPTPCTLLACAAELFGSTVRAKLYSVVTGKSGDGPLLSPVLEASVRKIVSSIQSQLSVPAR